MARNLIELEDARRIVLESCARLPEEPVALDQAHGRILAAELRAESAVPGFDNSTMDGFAVRTEDTAPAEPGHPVRLRIAGESRAGHPADLPLEAGEAIRISTGAMIPEGADAILRLEEASGREGEVETETPLLPGRDIRRAGEDIEPGQVVLDAGTLLGPAELGVLASVGSDPVPCVRRPRVSVLSTGDELVDPPAPLGPGEIHDSNRLTVSALARGAGAEVATSARAADDPEAVRRALTPALESDAVVICGGVSVGEHDHVRRVLEEVGAEQRFWGVALRPGRPTWFGVSSRGSLVFGLPGNPVSAVVTFLLLVRPALRVLSGAAHESERVTAVLDDDYAKQPGRTHAVRVFLRAASDGWHASLTRPEQASHILTSMLGANGLAMVPSGSEGVSAGDVVEVELIPPHAGP
jgi:molybdopterin molybdotransferase